MVLLMYRVLSTEYSYHPLLPTATAICLLTYYLGKNGSSGRLAFAGGCSPAGGFWPGP